MAYGPDLEQVYDTIFNQFLTTWEAQTPALNGGVMPPIEWPDEPSPEVPLSKGKTPWCRIGARHQERYTTTIGYQLPGQGRVKAYGVVKVNIFVPAGKRGLAFAARLGKVAVAAFEGQRAGDIWFTDVVPQEVGVDGAWYQFDVKATFHYDNHL
jgi:hypothetical protein